MITHRRICWPDPDATCLAGGCIYCNDHPLRSMRTIRRYANSAGVLVHRGGGSEAAWDALQRGEARLFPNVETRES